MALKRGSKVICDYYSPKGELEKREGTIREIRKTAGGHKVYGVDVVLDDGRKDPVDFGAKDITEA